MREAILDLCFGMVEYFPLVLVLGSVCTLRGFVSVAGAVKRMVLVGPLSALGLLYCVQHAVVSDRFPFWEIDSVEDWIACYFGVVPLLCGVVLLAVFAAYFAIANHDSVLFVGDLIVLVLVPILFLVPYFFSFIMLVVADLSDVQDLGDCQTLFLSVFILVLPATFILFEQIAIIAIVRVKQRWSERFFFGNDINERCCFTVPIRLSSDRGMRSWIGNRKEGMVEIPASFFLLEVRRFWGEGYRRGSIARNLIIFFRESVAIRLEF